MNKKLFIGATLVTVTVVAGLVYYRHMRQTQEPDEIVQVDVDGVPHNIPKSVLDQIEESLS